MTIKKYCNSCDKQIDNAKKTYYMQIFQREDRGNRASFMLCNSCFGKLPKFIQEDNNLTDRELGYNFLADCESLYRKQDDMDLDELYKYLFENFAFNQYGRKRVRFKAKYNPCWNTNPFNLSTVIRKIVDLEIELEKECNQ